MLINYAVSGFVPAAADSAGILRCHFEVSFRVATLRLRLCYLRRVQLSSKMWPMPKKLESRLRSAKRSVANRLRRRRKTQRSSSSDPNLHLTTALAHRLQLEDMDSQHSAESSPTEDLVFDDEALVDGIVRATLCAKMENLNLCNNLIEKHGELLVKAVNREAASGSVHRSTIDSLLVFKLTSQAMTKASSDITQFLTNETGRLDTLMKKDYKSRMAIENQNVELKLEILKLKNELSLKCLELAHKEDAVDSDLEDMFFDAASVIDFSPHRFDVSRISRRVKRTTSVSLARRLDLDDAGFKAVENNSETDSAVSNSLEPSPEALTRTAIRRSRVAERPASSLNYLSLMKNCIGKDLSRITMPVCDVCNPRGSFLNILFILISMNLSPLCSESQRLSDLEYSSILDEASKMTNYLQQLSYVAVFAVSGYSSTALRTTKPFNPLLGETYECDRMADLGWKSIAEQVSHHPPASAMYAEGRNWNFRQNYTITTKIRGKTLNVMPVGSTYITFSDVGVTYSYSKVTTATTIANIVTGKMVTDNVGEITVTNDVDSCKCIIRFPEPGYFSRELPRKVTGEVFDEQGKIVYRISGKWDKEVRVIDENTKAEKTVWTCKELPEMWQKMHSFTKFEIELNEPESGVAPTDSRLRPDQRKMENGDFEAAAQIKEKLEECQRERGRQNEEAKKEHQPRWFAKKENKETGEFGYQFTGRYWECKEAGKWDQCLQIFDSATTAI
ncbi:hypothetical protein L596_027457 [Steinernema carpocapsae]|uniref:Oxysterol-binding protein n=1 Tax=Steinernema carpocapsae TaxID=34508 RepID=A0A4U5LVJ0_STECR|nr:hypothetical protein L596_027457 [Steinernema carpocapsae]